MSEYNYLSNEDYRSYIDGLAYEDYKKWCEQGAEEYWLEKKLIDS